MAADLVRQGRQRPAPGRLGVSVLGPRGPCSRRASRPTLAQGPPQPAHRRAGFLPLLRPRPVPLAPLVRVAGAALGHRGAPADQQGPGRAGPAPGAPRALLVSVGHPCRARPRPPSGGGHDRTRPTLTTVRADQATTRSGTCLRPWSFGPSPVPPTNCAGRCGDADTGHASAPAITTTGRLATMKITIYGWRMEAGCNTRPELAAVDGAASVAWASRRQRNPSPPAERS